METLEPTAKKRLRASVACTYCRSKRSKCDAIPGKQPCTQCVARGAECELSSAKRNRGHYKPQVEALTRKVQILEQQLALARNTDVGSSPETWPRSNAVVSPVSMPSFHEMQTPAAAGTNHATSNIDFEEGEEYMDQQIDVYSATSTSLLDSQPNASASKTAQEFPQLSSTSWLKDLQLTSSVVDYLLGLYFHRYQLMMKFVTQQDFMAQLASGNGHTLRPSLLLAMLAAALRYNTRPEIAALYLQPDGENILAEAAKKAIEPEIRNCDITTVQILLILAEVETCSGHDMTGYLYTCMATKLIFELGLDLTSSSSLILTDEEIDCRYWLIWVASVGDQYWAVSLKKPVTIKTQTLQISRLAARFAWNGSLDSQHNTVPSHEYEVNESLLDFLELAREVTDTMYGSGIPLNSLQMVPIVMKLRSKLEVWFSRLPDKIRSGPMRDSYHFLFVLHMHYWIAMIVLHQDLVKENSLANQDFMQPMREILFSSAIRIAKLCEMFRCREDVRTLQITGTQWAGIATYALIGCIPSLSADEVVEAAVHLQSLARTLKDQSKTFRPAVGYYEDACRSLHELHYKLDSNESINLSPQRTPQTQGVSDWHQEYSRQYREWPPKPSAAPIESGISTPRYGQPGHSTFDFPLHPFQAMPRWARGSALVEDPGYAQQVATLPEDWNWNDVLMSREAG